MIPFEQTQQDVAEVKKDLKELKALLLNKAEKPSKTDDPLSIDETAELTGYTKPTIYAYCQKNTIPYHKKGGRLFFFRSEIINWIRQGKQKTHKDILADVDRCLSDQNKSNN